MDNENTRAPDPLRHVQQSEIDRILKSVWETAVRRNPMCLVNMIDPNSALRQLQEMIRDCLARGLSEARTSEHVLGELLQSAALGTLPRTRCDDASPEGQPTR